MSFRSPLPDVAIPNLTLFDYLFSDVAAAADQPAVIDGPSGAQTTYRQLVGQIAALAGGLAQRGFADGDVAGILCPNIPAFVTVFHGILRAGGTATTINSLYTADEITGQLRDSGARYLFTISAFLPQADAAAGAAGLPTRNVVVIDGSDQVAPGRTSLRDLLSSGAPPPELDIDPGTHLAVLPYSSGTTGLPKGAMLTHRNLVANLAQGVPIMGVTGADRILAVLPFFHIYGMNVLMNGGLLHRSPVITMPRFDLPEFLRIIAAQRATFVFIAPPIAVLLAKHPIVDVLRPLVGPDHHFRGGPARRQAGTVGGRQAGLRGAAGIRHDRDEPGEPHDSPGPGRHRFGHSGYHSAEHGVQDRRPGHRPGDRHAGNRNQRTG